MLDRPAIAAVNLAIAVHHEVPANWPSANAAGEARCHVFQTREFIAAWSLSFGSTGQISAHFVEVTDPHGALLLQIPLAIERKRGVNVLSFVDHGHADYNAPVCYPSNIEWTSEIVRHLWTRIVAELPPFDVARLDKMPERVADLINPLFLLADQANDEACHGNNLTLDWAGVEKGLQSPKEIRSKQKSLEKLGTVRFVIAEDAAMRERMLDRLIAQKQRRFVDTKVPGFKENPQSLAFIRQATEIFAASGILFLCALLVGDEIVAVQWALAQGTTLYALVTSFEAGPWTKLSSGRILNYHLLKWLHGHGYSYLDQGYGDEAYKLQNCDTTVPLSKSLEAHSLLGRLQIGREALSAWLRAQPLWAKLRPLKWVLLRTIRQS